MRPNATNVRPQHPQRNTESTLSPTHEWRVSWRRVGWSSGSSNKARRFLSRHRAIRFIARLRDVDKLHSRALITLEQREAHYGAWELVRVGGRS